MTTVVNIKKEPYDVYIGRAGHGKDGYFGNAHTMGYVYCHYCKGHHNREDSIEAFRRDFLKRIKVDREFKRRVLDLQGKILGCFCKPLACHGDVIKEWLDSQANLP